MLNFLIQPVTIIIRKVNIRICIANKKINFVVLHIPKDCMSTVIIQKKQIYQMVQNVVYRSLCVPASCPGQCVILYFVPFSSPLRFSLTLCLFVLLSTWAVVAHGWKEYPDNSTDFEMIHRKNSNDPSTVYRSKHG